MNNEILYSDTWTTQDQQEIRRLHGPILIVGVSGFIGANLYFGLSKYRDDVYGCSRNPKRNWRLSEAPGRNLISLDITNHEQLKFALNKLRPRTIFNVSAYGGYARQSDSDTIHKVNYLGTNNILRVLSELGCDAFVHSGSQSEYGLNCTAPNEDDELIPNSDYAVSKVGADYLIKFYGRILNFPCVNLRLYSVYGPWEERDRLISTLVLNGLLGKYPNLADKTISRDFVYIDDCIMAFVKSALTACKNSPGSSINIATGIKTTLEDVAKTAKKVFSIKADAVFGVMHNRKWDLSNWYGNPDLAEKLIGWKYRTSFEAGLILTAKWEQEASEKLRYVVIPKSARKISMVIACYKDSQSIPVIYNRLVQTFAKIDNEYEIIFVNDSSPENDEQIIESLCSSDIRVIGISHSRNFGSQSAFVSGMEIATGDAVILMDGDGQDSPEVIPEFIDKWNEGYDIVYGERKKREAPIYMRIFYKLFYRVFRQLSDIRIPVDAGDFSLIDRKAVEYLLEFTEKDIFLRGLRAWIGFKQIGVPYNRPERLFGKSTNSFFRNIWWAKKGIFSFSIKPLQYIQSIGLVISFIAFVLSVFYITSYLLVRPTAGKGTTTIILICLGLGGIQLVSMSILGDYIGKITEEVKNRPKFIRNKILFNGRVFDKQKEIAEIIKEIKTNQPQ